MAEAGEGTAIPGEEEGSTQSPQLREEQEVAMKDAARAKGWRPLKEWDGDPADWVGAREFLGREKLFKKIHDLTYALNQQGKRHEGELKMIRGHFEKVRESEYQRAVKDLKAAQAEAIAAGDAREAARIDERIEQVREEQAAAKAEAKVVAQTTQQAGPSPEFQDWQGKNRWFGTDQEATQLALEIGNSHAAANPAKSQADVLAYVERTVRKAFPEKFQSQRRTGSPVEGGGSLRLGEGVKDKKGKYSVNDLNPMQREILNTLLKTKALDKMAKANKRSETEEYIAQLAEVGGLQ